MTSAVVAVAPSSSEGETLLVRQGSTSFHWLPLTLDLPTTGPGGSNEFGGTYADAGWTLVDHFGLGAPTMLVPPAPGKYAAGAHISVIPHFVSGAPETWYLRQSLVIINNANDAFNPENNFDLRAFHEVETVLQSAWVGQANSNTNVFAPKMLDGSGQQIGFSWCAQVGADTVGYSGGRLWAYATG